MTSSALRDDSWAYSHKAAAEDTAGINTLASTSTTVKRPSLQMPEQQAADALTGLLLSSPTKKARTTTTSENGSTTVAGYSPELSKALKSVVSAAAVA